MADPLEPTLPGAPTAPDVSNTTPASGASPTDGPGAGASHPPATLEGKLLAATRRAIGLDAGKRRPGQRGPDKGPRRRPVARAVAGNGPVVDDAFAQAVDALPASPDSLDEPLEPPPARPAVDEETLRALAEGLTGLVEDLGQGIIRRVAMQETRDSALATEAAKTAVMSERTRKLIIFGAIECAKKYSLDTTYAPEACLGVGLMLYSAGIGLALKELRATGTKLRGAKPA